MADQPCSWAGVGAGNDEANHSRTAGENASSPIPPKLTAEWDGQMWFYEAAPTSAVQKAQRLAAMGIDDRQ